MAFDERYESGLIRGSEAPRPWNIFDEVRRYARPTDQLLDVGCKTAFKTVALSPIVGSVVGLEANPALLAYAQGNVRQCRNVRLVQGRGDRIPFGSETFDVLTCIAEYQWPAEFARVVKPRGWIVSEQIAEGDKRELVELFGRDDQGPRGFFGDRRPGAVVDENRRLYAEHCTEVQVREGHWDGFLTLEGLILLLEQTPLVRGFDRTRDAAILTEVQARFSTDRGIRVRHHRVLVTARK